MIGLERVFDKVGIGAIVVAALGCAACFPALGTLAATFGLGFLGQYEGTIINGLLPLFTMGVLFIHGYGWYKNQSHWRGLLSVIGPLTILITLYPLWQYSWSVYLFYSALILMLTVSIADLICPVPAHCKLRGLDNE
jgi:mercuric ion transport protein